MADVAETRGLMWRGRAARAGLPWPNPGCPVMMVECESGLEERSAAGSLAKARSPPPAAADAAQPGGSSYFNKQEAVLAVRCAPAARSFSLRRCPRVFAHGVAAGPPQALVQGLVGGSCV